MNKKWTEDEDNFIIVCCKCGWHYADIANELNRSYYSVEHRVRRLLTSNGKATKTTKQYIKELKIKCPSMICLGTYINNKTPILHKCLKCNKEYNTRPNDKLSGWACKYCGTDNNGGGIPPNKSGITYLVYIPKYDLFKFGITSKSVKERMRDNRLSEYVLILERKFELGINAMNLEKLWKENLKEYLVNTGLLKSGNTETFRI